MGVLGCGSKAIAGAYGKKAQVELPSLEEYENALKADNGAESVKR